MAGDISKKLDKKVKQMEIGSILGDLAVVSNKLKDQMNKKDKLKAAQGLRMGGRAGYKSGSKGCKLAMKGKGRAYGKNS